MNNPDYISESLETVFWVTILNSLMRIRDPEWKKFGSGIRKGEKFGSRNRDKHLGSAALKAMLWIRNYFCRIRTLGSVTLSYGYGSYTKKISDQRVIF
jgi:hypothetical protein